MGNRKVRKTQLSCMADEFREYAEDRDRRSKIGGRKFSVWFLRRAEGTTLGTAEILKYSLLELSHLLLVPGAIAMEGFGKRLVPLMQPPRERDIEIMLSRRQR
jgi:hypothetical protein